MPKRQLIHVDVVSDTVCPWCFIGKTNLEKAIEATKDKYDVEVQWRPFLLNPGAPKEGIDKKKFYEEKFGIERMKPILAKMEDLFAERGYEYKLGGKTGSTIDSHRLLEFAAKQGLEKQNDLVQELFLNYFTQEKYIGDRKVLLDAAEKVGLKGAKEWLEIPENGMKELKENLEEFAQDVTGVPFFRVGKYGLSGAQPPSVFEEVFERYVNNV